MRKLQLVMASASQIQSYIFASNRLREHVGASHLVAQATGAWALEAVQEAAARSNVLSHDGLLLDEKFAIECEPGDAAEVIYSGGGNVEVLFTSADSAGRFVRTLSERLLCEAPGLRVAFGRAEFDWGGERSIEAAAASARKAVEAAKRAPTSGGGAMLGLGVTAACVATGAPATAIEDGAPISTESAARLAAFGDADERLRHKFESALGEFRFPYDLDKLGRSVGEDSHIAVIHADGNGFGAVRRQALEGSANNREYVHHARSFSDVVRRIADDALGSTLDVLCERVRRDTATFGAPCIRPEIEGRDINIDLRPAKGSAGQAGVIYLPVRPIIHGGDDLTLVCDGRIALSFVEEYLHQFEAASGSHIRALDKAPERLTACAGAAIVRAHFPFARAYDMAEELCDEAKKRRAETKADASYMDWHIAMSGLIGGIEEIRRRDYHIRRNGAADSLTLRPVTVSSNNEVRSWKTVENGIRAFQIDWADKRNKVKALREALRGGVTSVQRFVTNYSRMSGGSSSVLPALPNVDAEKYGWVDGRCTYYDAVELMDMYVPLSTVEVEESEERRGAL